MSEKRSQNVTTRATRRALRHKKIPLLKLRGLSDEAIAEELGVTRRTIARDKESINWSQYIDPLFEQMLEEYAQLMKGDKGMKNLSITERGKLLRKIIPSTINQEVEVSLENEFRAVLSIVKKEAPELLSRITEELESLK